jgi:hypothetical protein
MTADVLNGLNTALHHALEERAENGLENADNLSLAADWSASPHTVIPRPSQNRLVYNLRALLMDAHRLIPDKAVKQRAAAGLHEEEHRPEAARAAVRYWNNTYEDEPAQAVTVSTLFHGVERLVIHKNLAVQDTFFDRFAAGAAATMIRDRLYRGLLPSETRVKMVQDLGSMMNRYTQSQGELPPTAVYDACTRFVAIMEHEAENPAGFHDQYQELDRFETLLT